jgi:3-deoxy-manno-octulosonate cytidylyltransferase (CMP-KDO synthetase)
MRIVALIPARYKSSRFEGKPLAGILGKPMVWHVFNQVKKVKEIDEIYVATDDDRIKETCEKLSIPVIMTSDKHPTGTDRVCEVSNKIKADVYINVQGDEPMIEPENIVKAIQPLMEDANLEVSNLMTKIVDPVEIVNCTVPKVVVNNEGRGVFLSRSPIPYPKGKINYSFFKQVCVYGFKKEALDFFAKSDRGKAEEVEDIEILRFIEGGYDVKYIEVESNTVAVDTPKDLEKVVSILKGKNET